MYGSVFQMRPKQGMSGQLRDVIMSTTRRPKGMVQAFLLAEDGSGDVWGFAVFDDERAYRNNASDPAQDVEYRKLRELLVSDPQWHDGSIDSFPTVDGGVIHTPAVTNDDAMTGLLTRLASIAKAPMTAQERELRAKPLLGGGLNPAEVAQATSRSDLPWNKMKASEYEVAIETWIQAVWVVDLPASTSLAELLERLHRAEAAADLLKAGYEPGRNWLGVLSSGQGMAR